MPKRCPESPLTTGEPPTKAFKPEPPVSDTSNQPTGIRRVHHDSNEWPSQDMPPPEQRGVGRAAGGDGPARGHASTATDFAMTPESSTSAGAGETDQKRYDIYDPMHHSTDASRRSQADSDLYRQHFSGYRDDRAHLSANPYIESDPRLEDGEHYHHFPRESQGGTHTHERRADPSLAYPRPVMSQHATPSQHDTRSHDIAGYRRRDPGASMYHLGERDEVTKGDKEGRWTQRVRNLRDFAESRGASLRSMSPEKHPPSFNPDSPGPKQRTKSVGENEVRGKEATMALYSYPRMENGRPFFSQVPEARREELEKVKRDLKDMEQRLQNATKERISEVTAALDTGPSSQRPVPPPRRD